MSLVAWKDWKTKHIPDKYILCIFAAGITSLFLPLNIALIEHVTGGFVVSVPLLILASLIPGSIGGGDIKLMAAGGLLVGITGIWNVFVTGIMSAGIYISVLLIMKKANRKTEIALGPFLAIGLIIEIVKI